MRGYLGSPILNFCAAIGIVVVLHGTLLAEEPARDSGVTLEEQVNRQADQLDKQRLMLEQQQAELQSLRRQFDGTAHGTFLQASSLSDISDDAEETVVSPETSFQFNAPAPTAITSGYDNGFFIRNAPKSPGDDSFLMKIRSWQQFRHTFLDSDSSGPDQNDFEFERLRLTFGGHAWTPHFKYFIQLDAGSDQAESVSMLDYYMSYDLADAIDLEPGDTVIRVGKWKMPFNRSRAGAGWKMQLVDRSLASVIFDINRSLGIGVFNKYRVGGRPVNTELAIHNGFKTGGFRPVRANELDRNFAVSGRVYSDVIGEWGKDGEVDLNMHECPAVRIGAGFALTQVDIEGLREFQRQRVIDSGATLASLLPASVSDYDVAMYSVDANLKYQGLSVLTEYYFRQMTGFENTAIPTLNDHGFMVQAGWFLIAERLELAARWSRIVGDSGSLGGVERSADEVAGGINVYFRGHNAKLQFDVTHLNGSPMADRALNILPGDSGLLYRTQFQIVF